MRPHPLHIYMVMDTLAISIILVFLSLILVRQWYTRQARTLPLPPGPSPLPLIGNTLQVPTENQWHTFTKWASIWGEFHLVFPWISRISMTTFRLMQVTSCTSMPLGCRSSSSALRKPRMMSLRNALRTFRAVISLLCWNCLSTYILHSKVLSFVDDSCDT